MPARLLKTDMARVYHWEIYAELESHFSASEDSYFTYTGVEDETPYIEKSMFI